MFVVAETSDYLITVSKRPTVAMTAVSGADAEVNVALTDAVNSVHNKMLTTV